MKRFVELIQNRSFMTIRYLDEGEEKRFTLPIPDVTTEAIDRAMSGDFEAIMKERIDSATVMAEMKVFDRKMSDEVAIIKFSLDSIDFPKVKKRGKRKK